MMKKLTILRSIEGYKRINYLHLDRNENFSFLFKIEKKDIEKGHPLNISFVEEGMAYYFGQIEDFFGEVVENYDDLSKNTVSLEQKISIIKKMNKYQLYFFKIAIYHIENVFNLIMENHPEFKKYAYNFHFHHFSKSIVSPLEMLSDAIYASTLYLLNIKISNNITIESEKEDKVVISLKESNIDFIANKTRFVKRYPLIDESLTDHYQWIDEEIYEKGREFQWRQWSNED